MIGQLVDGHAEIGASPLFVTVDRVAIIEYIAMPSPTRSKFVFRKPKLSYTNNVFLLPFNRMLWFSLVGLVCATAFILGLVTLAEWKVPLHNTVINYIQFK